MTENGSHDKPRDPWWQGKKVISDQSSVISGGNGEKKVIPVRADGASPTSNGASSSQTNKESAAQGFSPDKVKTEEKVIDGQQNGGREFCKFCGEPFESPAERYRHVCPNVSSEELRSEGIENTLDKEAQKRKIIGSAAVVLIIAILFILNSGGSESSEDMYKKIKEMYIKELEQIHTEWLPELAKKRHMSENELIDRIISDTGGIHRDTFYHDWTMGSVWMLGELDLTSAQASAVLDGVFEDQGNRIKIPVIKRSLLTYGVKIPDLLDYLFTEVDKGKIKNGIRLDITARIADHVLKRYEKKLHPGKHHSGGISIPSL